MMHIVAQDAEMLDAWTQVLEDCEREDADNIDEEIGLEYREMHLNRERAETTKYPSQYFATRSEVQKLITAELEK